MGIINTAAFYIIIQVFRYMEGPGHCPMITKYGPSLFKAVGPVDPSFLVVQNLTLIKISHSISTKQKVHVGTQYSKTCLKKPPQKRQNKDLNNH